MVRIRSMPASLAPVQSPFFTAFGLVEHARPPHLADMSGIDIETTPKGEWGERH